MNVNGGGRPPDYIVKVGLRGEKFHKRVGAAWTLKQGGIAVKIDPGLALVSGTDVLVSLWPSEEKPKPNYEANDDRPPY